MENLLPRLAPAQESRKSQLLEDDRDEGKCAGTEEDEGKCAGIGTGARPSAHQYRYPHVLERAAPCYSKEDPSPLQVAFVSSKATMKQSLVSHEAASELNEELQQGLAAKGTQPSRRRSVQVINATAHAASVFRKNGRGPDSLSDTEVPCHGRLLDGAGACTLVLGPHDQRGRWSALVGEHVKSLDDVEQVTLHFKNQSLAAILEVFWVGYDKKLVRRHSLQPGDACTESSFATHPWLLRHRRSQEAESPRKLGGASLASEAAAAKAKKTKTPKKTPKGTVNEELLLVLGEAPGRAHSVMWNVKESSLSLMEVTSGAPALGKKEFPVASKSSDSAAPPARPALKKSDVSIVMC